MFNLHSISFFISAIGVSSPRSVSSISFPFSSFTKIFILRNFRFYPTAKELRYVVEVGLPVRYHMSTNTLKISHSPTIIIKIDSNHNKSNLQDENYFQEMYAKIANFIDVDLYKETFETNLNKGERRRNTFKAPVCDK